MSCGIGNAIAFSPTILYCWICKKIRERSKEESRICGFSPFDSWSISLDHPNEKGYMEDHVSMYKWEKIGLIIVFSLNFLVPIVLLAWLFSIIPEDEGGVSFWLALSYISGFIGIALALCGAFALAYWLLNWFVFEKNETNKKCRFFGHQHITDAAIRQGRPQKMYCPKCGKIFGEYRIESTFDHNTLEVRRYDKDGNEIF